jgi:hypothetical protein
LEDFEIGRILHLKFEIRNRRLDRVQFPLSDFEFQMQDSSNFKIFQFQRFLWLIPNGYSETLKKFQKSGFFRLAQALVVFRFLRGGVLVSLNGLL